MSEEFPVMATDVKWLPGSIYNAYTNVIFAFMSEDHRQCHAFQSCRDYLGDIVFCSLNKWTLNTFRFDPQACPPVSMNKARVLAHSGQADFATKARGSEDMIHQAEDALKIPRSAIERTRTRPTPTGGAICLTGDAAWMTSPVMLSLYTLLFRVGLSHTVGDDWLKTFLDVGEGRKGNFYADKFICKQALSGVKRLVEKGWEETLGTDLVKNYPDKTSDGATIRDMTTHSAFGIYAFSLATSKVYCPHWY